jgi:protein-glutamine gamma-glutamyltransferase
MYLERLLQINLATLATLGALLLGMGERSVGPPIWVAIAAPAAVWLTDVTGWFRLNRRTANLLMLVAAAVSARDLFPTQSEFQAFGLAWFLIYLQIILLFQEKDARTYWLLVTLSLLQVVVATLFSQGVWFGIMLLVYMLLGFSAMALLLLYQQRERAGPVGIPSPQPYRARCHGKERVRPARRSEAERAGSLLSRLIDAIRRFLNPEPRALSPVSITSDTAVPKRALRWSLAGQQTYFAALPGGSARAAMGNDLFAHLGRMGLYTLALTLLLFLAVPRFGQFAWRGPIVNPEPLVGFTDTVTLGELGQIIESHDEVMRVQFFDQLHDAPRPVGGEIYLQGALLMTYDHGAWRAGTPSMEIGSLALARARQLPETGLVRQEIDIEGLDRDELFFVAPYIALKSDPEISIDLASQRLTRPYYRRARRFSYTLGTTAIVNDEQLPLAPAVWGDSVRNALAMPEAKGAGALPNLVALAQRWMTESGLPKEDTVRRARYLERQFSVSGRFQYSLVGQARDSNIDPIEDFVTKHPEGHCEYFATALTLMLRSQGIPARMVVGFKCDDWNALGGFYQVRQSHAHTWVEAYLKPSQLPPDLIHGKDYWPWQRCGGWLRLDPTPGGTTVVAEQSAWTAPIRHAEDWLDFAWSNYVVELDYRRQQNAIYQPIIQTAKNVLRQLTDPERWHAMLGPLADLLHFGQLNSVRDWLIALTAAAFAATILLGAGWLVWRVGRRFWRRWARGHARRGRGHRAEVEFYRRFETLLARQGLVRSPSQTQREFAAAAGAHLVMATGENRLAELPEVVVEAFYHIRFGCQPLDNLQVQAVEHALAEITAAPKAMKVKT